MDAIDQSGRKPDETIVNDLPPSAELLRAAFDTEVGVENPAVNIGSDGYVFFEVQGITPARDRPLDEVKAKVTADWIAAETEKRLADKVTELEKRLKDGAALDVIAGELKLEKQTKRGLKRQADDVGFRPRWRQRGFCRRRRRFGGCLPLRRATPASCSR